MNATDNAKDEIAMKIDHLPRSCLEILEFLIPAIINLLTCKPATRKEGHRCILYWSYAQTSVLPNNMTKKKHVTIQCRCSSVDLSKS